MQLVSSYRFKALAHDAIDLGTYGVRKETAGAVIENAGDRVLRFVISTGAVDRDRDMIDPTGWALENYRKNPVVLWSHNTTQLPLGRVTDLANTNEHLSAAVEFLPANDYGAASEFADTVYRLARDGYLFATSVGFRPLAWDFTTDKERGAEDWFPGIDFHSQELVELSLVAVPANPDALIEPMIPNAEVPVDAPAEITAALQEEARMTRARRRRALQLIEAAGWPQSVLME